MERVQKIPTAQLNRWLKVVQEIKPPRVTRRGQQKGRKSKRTATRYLKYQYIVQTHTQPMRFQIFTNAPNKVSSDDRRFLENRLRREFQLGPLPIEFRFRGKA